jgi:hypothetical protein
VEQLARDAGALRRVGVGHGDAKQLERRALQRITQRPAIVDIGADVGVEQNFHAPLLRRGRQACDERPHERQHDSQAMRHVRFLDPACVGRFPAAGSPW